jgi:hypothetical protein
VLTWSFAGLFPLCCLFVASLSSACVVGVRPCSRLSQERLTGWKSRKGLISITKASLHILIPFALFFLRAIANRYVNPFYGLLAGISPKTMTKNFRGEAIYTAEQDVHFPALTVGDTLAFAAEARSVSMIVPTPLFDLTLAWCLYVSFRRDAAQTSPGRSDSTRVCSAYSGCRHEHPRYCPHCQHQGRERIRTRCIGRRVSTLPGFMILFFARDKDFLD